MKKKLVVSLSIVAVIVVITISFIGWIVGLYNKLLIARANVDNQWAQVETQYQRRFDLIPNLVSSVQGIMQQEQKVFSNLAEARSKYAGATNINDKVSAVGALEGALSRLLVIMENYPQLKSNEAVQSLMAELSGTENRIAVELRRYNDTVKNYNLMITIFPNNLIANFFGFTSRNYFQSQEGAEEAPTIKFDI